MLKWICDHRSLFVLLVMLVYVPLFVWLMTWIPHNLQQAWAMLIGGVILWVGFLMFIVAVER